MRRASPARALPPRALLALARLAFVLPALALLAPTPAAAAWPDRPIALIVGFAPGGGSDIAARTLARFLERRLGHPVVVQNRPGAAGSIGYAATARAAADGNTIGMINTPNVVTLPIERRAGYEFADLQAVANIVDDPGGLWVRADSPYRGLAEVLAAARAQPEALSWGSTGRGTYTDFSRLALEAASGARFTLVAYGGTQPIIQGLLSGDLATGVFSMAEAAISGAREQLRPLGQMAATRSPVAPDVPTFREQGFDIVASSMRGIAAPAGVPREIIARLADHIREVMDDPDFRRSAAQQSLPLRYLGPDELQAVLAGMQAEYRRIWQARPWIE